MLKKSACYSKTKGEESLVQLASVYKRIKENKKTVSEKYMQPIRIMKIADTRAIQFDVMGKEAYEATVLFKHLYYNSLIHLNFFFFFW